MPTLPQPIKHQLGQLVKGSWETIKEQPKEMAKTALEQVGVSSPPTEKKPSQSVLKPGETMSPEAIAQKRKQDLMNSFQLVKKLEEEALQIHKQKIQEKEEAEKQKELAKQEQVQAAQQNSTIAPSEPRRKRGFFGMGGKKKQTNQLSNAMEKSHADKIGGRTSG